jgi:DNA mismatch endonuclease, patch repair protein
MTDVHSRAQRSYNMSRIRFRGNQTTEMRLVALLKKWHITGWRRRSNLFGKPDLVFQETKVALFVDGCFWHHCPRCKFEPTSSRKYWTAKFARNQKRDKEVNRTLRSRGWQVLRIREHELRNTDRVLKRLRRLLGT